MNRLRMITLFVSLAVSLALGLLLVRADSYSGSIRAITIETGKIVAGDPDEPSYADSIACGADVATPYFGWPFTTSKGTGRCGAPGLRLTIYPIGVALNVAIASGVGVAVYILLNQIRRRS